MKARVNLIQPANITILSGQNWQMLVSGGFADKELQPDGWDDEQEEEDDDDFFGDAPEEEDEEAAVKGRPKHN